MEQFSTTNMTDDVLRMYMEIRHRNYILYQNRDTPDYYGLFDNLGQPVEPVAVFTGELNEVVPQALAWLKDERRQEEESWGMVQRLYNLARDEGETHESYVSRHELDVPEEGDNPEELARRVAGLEENYRKYKEVGDAGKGTAGGKA